MQGHSQGRQPDLTASRESIRHVGYPSAEQSREGVMTESEYYE